MLLRLGLLRTVYVQVSEPETAQNAYFYDDSENQAAFTDDAENNIYEVKDE